MSEVPSATLVDSFSQWLWVFLEPINAVWNSYNPWTVLGVALLAGLAPFPKQLISLKALTAVVVSYVAHSLWPLYAGLPPLWPEPLAIDAYIRLGFLLIEAVFVVWATQTFLTGLKGLAAPKLGDAAQAIPLDIGQATYIFKRQIDDLVPASLNFTLQVAAPVALPVTLTISVPRKLSAERVP